MSSAASIQIRARHTILATAIALGLFLVVVRVLILGYGSWRTIDSWSRDLHWMMVAAYYDQLFVAGMTGVFLLLLRLAGDRPMAARLVTVLCQVTALLALGLALVNIQFVYMVGRPFNYRWLYYSDFLRSTDSHFAVRESLSWQGLLLAGAIIAGWFGVARLARGVLARLAERDFSRRRLAVGVGVPCLVYFAYATWFLASHPDEQPRLVNSAVAFASSVFDEGAPLLFTMKTPVGTEDFQISAEPTAPATPPRLPGISNVVMVVLESVGAEYLEKPVGGEPIMPVLDRYRRQAAVFRNIYAPAPATDKSLVALLGAFYPWISYRSLTHEYPALPFPTLSGELQRRGYRTGFFNCSDNRFHKLDEFLEHHGFDTVTDWRDLTGERPVFVASGKDWPFLDGSDGHGTVAMLTRWIDDQPRQPFFGMIWTMMTHHPYFVVGKEHDFGVPNREFNRYLNALRYTDAVLGELLRHLEERGLADSTLVIVVGDHGEAFGQHGQRIHASWIYEENLRVPLMLIHPRLAPGEEHAVLGSLIDLAPTTLDLLGIPAPAGWQGRSLFDRHRSPRVYFYTTWSDFLFGYREGDRKYIFNATANRYEVYDLRADPQESHNLADRVPELRQAVPQRLAAWVQYQDRFLRDLVGRPSAGLAPSRGKE